MIPSKCCVRGCRRPVEIENQGISLCDWHWTQYCNDEQFWGKIELWLQSVNARFHKKS